MKTLSDSLGLTHNGKNFLQADWPAPANVKTLISTRNGGASKPPYHSLNVGAHVGDHSDDVKRNRQIIQEEAGVPVAYLNQIHSSTVVRAEDALETLRDADASVDRSGKAACAAMTADCLPVLFCDKAGTVVAAAHAGWRGLAGGVLQNTVKAMGVAPLEIMAYFGPAIGPDAFEVGQDVVDVFCKQYPEAERAFEHIGSGKYLADIYALARLVLQHEGVNMIYGGEHCTVLERDTFFSYRRDKQTGRMVSLIWLDKTQEAV
ncbi:peptidoglycan editing factor PgeF [Neisseria animalis]|uniref:Purine nucleoside phosphorylase n=1 Tax=Neisseria animalis TaxID=492 RepID=A0A5P3MNN1_NEIAN|nr:peptidoglycan editing factor PgeF [Neisseria animalis]QEY23152.1 peptidoglycan editing factor PgeF [Neisseria animalis]ROW32482.1 peptidoglycan editing factor PgeF [Neisseria animalis]VEE08251.1 Laccase domain protein yfiH [Neisseria animalis]